LNQLRNGISVKNEAKLDARFGIPDAG